MSCSRSFLFMCFYLWGDQTSINGLVLLENNQSTPSLVNNSLILIIKNNANHVELKINQDSFPIWFNFANIKQIRKNGIHLLTLLIFGFTHRLLWEGIIFRQNLFINHVNNITFIVRNVCKWDLNIIISLFILHSEFTEMSITRISMFKRIWYVQSVYFGVL
jgi:hypothetical protein